MWRCNAGKDPRSDASDKAMCNPTHGSGFQCNKQIVYGIQMMGNLREHYLMPEEIFSKKNRMVDAGTLCKTFFYDIPHQSRVPSTIALVNALNWYDRIAHSMAYMIFQAFGVPITAVETMLATIKNMKFFSPHRFWRFNVLCRQGYQHQNSGAHTGQQSLSGRLGCHQHMYGGCAQEEGAQHQIMLSNY